MSLDQWGPWGGPERGPLGRTRGRVFVAVALFVVTLAGSAGASFGQPEAREIGLAGVALLLVTPLALVFLLPGRPAAAVVASAGATFVFLLTGRPWGPAIAAPVVLLAAVILCGPPRRARVLAWAGAALLLGVVVTAGMLEPPVWADPGWADRGWADRGWGGPRNGWGPQHREPGGGAGGSPGPPDVGLSLTGLGAGTAWTAVTLLMAGAMRDRVTRRVAARAAARETAAERERTAVTAERLRIARELHDVLAHSLSGINVQAGVGLHLLGRDPEQARIALTNIRDTSRDALAEVRTVLGIVRAEAPDPAPPDATRSPDTTRSPGAPQAAELPGPHPPSSSPDLSAPLAVTWDLSGLDRLVAQTRAEGLAVTLDVDAPGIPERVAGAIHRVVQESLTNIRRHASGATRVAVSVRREGASCVVVVSDDGGAATPGHRAGYGLRGMRERVEALGGTLRTGPDDAGWLVRATFPLPGPDRPPWAEPSEPMPTGSTAGTPAAGRASSGTSEPGRSPSGTSEPSPPASGEPEPGRTPDGAPRPGRFPSGTSVSDDGGGVGHPDRTTERPEEPE
ncbi:sensor histidine kinase [Myceligenerans crystallogenes]